MRLFRFTFAVPKPDVWVAWGDATGPQDLSALLGFASAKVTQPVIVQGQTVPVETSESTGALPLGAVPVFVEAAP